MWQAVWKNSENEAQEKGKVQETVQRLKTRKEHGNRQNLTWSFTYITITPQHSLWLYEESFLVWFFFKWSEHTHTNTHTRGGLQGWLKPIAHQKMRCGCGGGGAGGVLNRARTHTHSGWPWRCAAITQFTGRPIESLSVDQYPIKAAHKEREAGRASERAG